MYTEGGLITGCLRGRVARSIVQLTAPPPQALALYLVDLNPASTLQALAQYLVNLNVWTHNLLTLRARKTKSQALITCSHDHCPWWWAGLSLFIITYSIAISVFVPFFRSLVGIITASTYLLCAYTLPAWFALRLFWGKTLLLERGFLLLLIPVSLLLSAVGLAASLLSLAEQHRKCLWDSTGISKIVHMDF